MIEDVSTRVLVVDDDDVILRFVSVALTRAGYEVFTASDGPEALEQVNYVQPDMIILDVRMPGLDGYEVCRRIRRRPRFARLPVLMLTANDTLEQKIKGFEAGTDDYMVKPFQSAELKARVQALLRRTGAGPQYRATPIESKVIAVFSLRGGVGVSTLAVNLALGLVQIWELPTTLVDAVFTCGHDALMLNLSLHSTWADLVDVPVDELDGDMLMRTLLSHPTELRVLAAPPTPSQGETIESRLFARVLELLIGSNHYLVLDLPHDFEERTLLGLDAAHEILVVMAPEIASIYAAKRTLEVFGYLGYDQDRVSLVLNQTFERRGVAREAIEDTLGRSVDFVVPFASAYLVDAINRGIPLVVKVPNTRIGASFEGIAFELSKEEHRTQQPEEPTPAWERVSRRL